MTDGGFVILARAISGSRVHISLFLFINSSQGGGGEVGLTFIDGRGKVQYIFVHRKSCEQLGYAMQDPYH